MMRELLAMFETAGAHASNNNLKIRFDFGEKMDDLEFDLRNFRTWSLQWSKLIRTVDVRHWNANTLWPLVGAFGSVDYRQRHDVRDRKAVEWLRIYDNDKVWPPFQIRMPHVPVEIVSHVEQVWAILNAFVDAARMFGESREHLRDLDRDRPSRDQGAREDRSNHEPEGFDRWQLYLVDSDGWAGALISAAYRFAEGASGMGSVDEVRCALDRIFAQVPVERQTIEQCVQELEELLNLPIWKHRHELYAAWVGARLVRAVGGHDTIVHQAAGQIVFRFSGTHFATAEISGCPRLELWAELRSPLDRPAGKGRKRSIQPDYTVAHAPVTNPVTTVIVVECKQYLKATAKGFAKTLEDYARGRPNAEVLLVNYGRLSENILEKVSDAVRKRTRAIGFFRPGRDDALREFESIVNAKLAHISTGEAVLNSAPVGVAVSSIVLSWAQQPRDLDLHLWHLRGVHQSTHIFFQNLGTVIGPPFAQLDRDCTAGQGPETIRIERLIPGSYTCAVHQYSSDGALPMSRARVEVKLPGMHMFFPAPKVGSGRWWYLFEYDSTVNNFHIINILQDQPPINS
jgi:hypothetical protein